MDRITAGILGIGLPAMFFVVVYAGSSSIYDASATPPPRAAPEEPAAEETAEAAPMEEDAGAEDDAMAEEPAEEAETAEEQAPVAEDEVAEAPADDGTEEAATDEAEAEAPAETETTETETETTDMAATAPEEAAGDDDAAEATEEAAAAPAEIDLAALVEAGDVRAGSRLWRQCSACHVADQEQNRVGPHLVDVLGRERASIGDFRYSDSLDGLDGVWTAEEMSAWLENPSDYAPGTSMSFRGLDDAGDRANIIAYLADLQLNGG